MAIGPHGAGARRAAQACAAAALLVLAASLARADTVLTREGKTYEGKVLSQDDASVVIETTFDGTVTVPRADVKSVDTQVPPLREQLRFRLEQAGKDAARLWEVHRWGKAKGFEAELSGILLRIVDANPEDRRARKLLGHEKVDGRWMTAEEKAAWLEEKQAEENRAKGLVLHDGRWMTPKEKEALEKGLLKDGDDWVTEEEYHRRRGEVRQGNEWVRVGEGEGAAWAKEASIGAGVTLQVLWGPHFDVLHDGMPEIAKKVLDAAEAAFAAARRSLRPTAADLPETVEARIRIVLFKKQPAYARFAKWFDQKEKASELVPGWARAVQKQHAWWWAHPERVAAVYQFPNPERTVVSNAIHNVGLILLTRYRLNYSFPAYWLQEGFAYVLEMDVLRYSESYTLGRGPTVPGGTGQATAPGAAPEPPAWGDSGKWRPLLQALVTEGRDPPLKRLSTMSADQMGYEELVKSWSVVEFLRKWDPGRFKAFVDATKKRDAQGTPADVGEALQEAYGTGWAEADKRWRTWVLGGYGTP